MGLVLACCSWQHLAEYTGRRDGEALPERAILLTNVKPSY